MVFSDPEFRFSVTIPHGWFVDSSGQQGTRTIIFKTAAVLGFRANVNVMIHQLGAMTSDEYVTFCRLQLKQMSGHPKMDIDQPAVQPQGAHVLEWHAPLGPMHLKMRQLFVFQLPIVFVITATALYNTFAEFRTDFEAILDSFHIEPAPDAAPSPP